jgi:hypothetical protein
MCGGEARGGGVCLGLHHDRDALPSVGRFAPAQQRVVLGNTVTDLPVCARACVWHVHTRRVRGSHKGEEGGARGQGPGGRKPGAW